MHNHGFTLIKETTVFELASTARLWRHDVTGAELLSFTNSDENKVFGVSFRTPPSDSTGVAHILEHSVLCGSKKFPVKEPFVELLKGSLQTFLNAFTYPDKTCYPVASCNLKDFRNLTDVYLDAVFFPRITESIFQQEGWHLEAENLDSPLTYKGVVYNEMKGAFSSPESVLGRYCLHALFPDTVYSLESGGDPMVIPDLTFEAFSKFHQNYYHPSNARFFFWGDDPEKERLKQIADVISPFEKKSIESTIKKQLFLAAPRNESIFYAAGDDDKAMVAVNWLGPDVTDIELNMAFRMLEHILLGMPASPLRRALIESGLGEDLAGSGLETELRQLTFDIGLKGVATENCQKVEDIILSTLEQITVSPLPNDIIEAAVNSIEFNLRENNSGRFPVGLSVMLRSLTTWLHEANPLAPLQFEAPLAAIKEKIANDDSYFSTLIKKWFLENTHRVTVTLLPDTTLAGKLDLNEQAKLQQIASQMTEKEKEAVVADTKALNLWQATPDSAENLATIPRLEVNDLARVNATIASNDLSATVPFYFHPLSTTGIIYTDICFTLKRVPERLLPLLPLFGRALLEIGTQKRSFVDLNMAIARKTGGMSVDTAILTHIVSQDAIPMLSLSAKCAPDKPKDLFALICEVLLEATFDNKDRFLAMALEEKARLEHSLVPSGHSVVAARLGGNLSFSGWLSEQINGIQSLFFIRDLVMRIGVDWQGVLHDLELLREAIICQDGMQMNFTAQSSQQAELQALASTLACALPKLSLHPEAIWNPLYNNEAEALLLPAQVNYVGKGTNLFASGYTWHGSAAVALKYLRTAYLWEKVRVQGGAYGCMCSFDRMNGAFTLVSYRDPNILPTLAIYDGIGEHLAAKPLDKRELNAAIVGAIGELDTYLLPDAKGLAAFARILCGDSDELRQKMREEILGTTSQDLIKFGEALHALTLTGQVCVLGGKAVESAAQSTGWPIKQLL